jgi:hypothetical protein
LQYNKTGDHPQEDLAKFGYRPDMKVEFFLESFLYIWLPAELVVKIWRIRGLSFKNKNKNPFNVLISYFSG